MQEFIAFYDTEHPEREKIFLHLMANCLSVFYRIV